MNTLLWPEVQTLERILDTSINASTTPTPAQYFIRASAVAKLNGRAPTTSSDQASHTQTRAQRIAVLVGFRGECHSPKQLAKGKISGKEIVNTDKVLHTDLYHRRTEIMESKTNQNKNIIASLVASVRIQPVVFCWPSFLSPYLFPTTFPEGTTLICLLASDFSVYNLVSVQCDHVISATYRT